MKPQVVIITAFCLTLVLGSNFLKSDSRTEICAFNGKLITVSNDICQLKDDNCHMEQKLNRWREIPTWVCFNQLNETVRQTCNRTLSEDSNSVCSGDGNHIQIFPSREYFDFENCLTNNRWIEVDLKNCGGENRTENLGFALEIDSNEDSSDVLSPICAIDTWGTLRKFKDKCAMHYDSCTYNREWKQTNMTLCEEEEIKSRCDRWCPGLYRPVCGFNGEKKKLFDNSCIFSMENCISGFKWRELYRYDCI